MERLGEKSSHPVSQLLSSLALPHYQRVCCKKMCFAVFGAKKRNCEMYIENIFEISDAVYFSYEKNKEHAKL